ncbi:MAG: nuclear transport factor 2 family protein [Polyangiaceae bacterium]
MDERMARGSRRTWTVLALASSIGLGAIPGCARPAAPDTRPATVAQLTAQAEGWDKAIVRKDRPAIEGNMAADFRQIDGAGNLETKASFVDGLVSPDLEIDPYAVEDFDVRLYGDTALLTGRTRMTGRYQGKAFTSHYRYTDVYVRSAGAWQVVSVQISKIPG